MTDEELAIEDYNRAAEAAVIGEMYEFLCDFEPVDPGIPISHRVKSGRGYALGSLRLYVPCANDRHVGGYNLLAGDMFSHRYVTPSESYRDVHGDLWSGRELLEKFGLVIGLDAVEAMDAFLDDAKWHLTTKEILSLGDKYQVARGRVAEILGDRVFVHFIKRGRRRVLRLFENV